MTSNIPSNTRTDSDRSIATVSSSDLVDVATRNRLVFRRYEKSFKNIADPAFSENAFRFAQWLSNERGYYQSARPEILKLVMIMHNTLRRAVGVPETQHVPFPPQAYMHHPMSEPYTRLVTTVHRYANFFVEPNLQALLKGLFFSVGLSYIPNTGSTASTSLTKSSHPGVVPPQHHVPNSPNSTPALPPQTTLAPLPSHTSTPLPHASTQGQPSSIPGGSATVSASIAPTNRVTLQNAFSNPIKRPDKPSDDGSVHAALITTTDSMGEASVSTVTVKKRKRKMLDLASFAELDLKNFLQKYGQAHPQTPSSSGITPQASLPTAHADSFRPASASDLSSVKVEEEASISLNGSHSHEVIEIFDTPEPPSQRASPLPEALPVKGEPIDDHGLLPANDHRQTYPLNDKGVVEFTSDKRTTDKTEPITIDEEPRSASQDGACEFRMDVDELLPIGQETIKAQRHSKSPVLLQVEDHSAEAPLKQQPESAMVNGEAPMEIDSASNTSLSSVGTDTTIFVPREISIVGETSVKSLAESKVASTADDVRMSTGNEGQENLPVTAVPSPMTDKRIYGDEMTVLAFQRGLTCTSRIQFTFDVSEEYFNAIVTWSKQKASLSELECALCISLGCYPVSQLVLSAPLAPQLMSISSSWPGEGSLSMKIAYQSNIEHFSLTPPLMVSPDSTVDLSMFIQPGPNSLELVQRRNWSEHVFILLAHNPTQRQIQKVEDRRREDQAWRNWLKQMAMPIVVRAFSPTAAPGNLETRA